MKKHKTAKCKKCGGPVLPPRHYGKCNECHKAEDAEARKRYQAKAALADIQQIRRECGLRPLEPTNVLCLCCRQEFTSWDKTTNRMCPDCADKSLGMAGGIQKWPGQVAGV